jgi:OOP family OmpA-OmpF porin
MTNSLRTAIAVAIGSVGVSVMQTAAAAPEVGQTYFVPQVGYAWLDNDRNAENDVFGGLAIGRHFSEAISLELGITAGEYEEPTRRGLDLRAYSLDALHIFARDSVVSPYITAGIGLLRTDAQAGDADHHPLAQAGFGLMINIGDRDDGSLSFALRPEVKARWALPNDNDPQDKYLDYVAGIGFQFAFGDPRPAPEPPAPPPPPPPPPPAPPPAPEPPKDSDGDGVIDARDKCPDTPAGVAVDVDGCPRRGTATLQGVTFEFNSARLTPASQPVLNEVAADLKRYPRLKIEVQGHSDSVGADAYNMKLSDQRANSVREYLISQGVPEAQLTAKGFGETQPLDDNKTEAGRAMNRRVVMNVVENPGNVDVTQERPAQTNEATR